MKKILSVFLTSTCLFSCITPGITVFADDDTSLTEEIETPYKKPPRPSIPEKSRMSSFEDYARQKAFLAALLCTTGTDVYIRPIKRTSKQYSSFTVCQIGNTIIETGKPPNNTPQLKALTAALKEKTDLDICFTKYKSLSQKIFKINNHILEKNEVLDYGKKILCLVYEASQSKPVRGNRNLTQDAELMREIRLLLKDILSPPEKEKGTFFSEAFKEIQDRKSKSASQLRMELIEKHNNRKALLTALLCLNDSDVYIKPVYNKSTSHKFKVEKIDDKNVENNKWGSYNEIEALITKLENKKDKLYFHAESTKNHFKLSSININGKILNNDEIDVLGKQISELLFKRNEELYKEKFYGEIINLSKDFTFTIEAKNILSDILNRKIPGELLPSNANSNPALESSDTDENIQPYNAEKALLTIILCAIGVDVEIFPKKGFKNQLREFRIIKINNKPTDSSIKYNSRISRDISALAEFLSEKIKFHYTPPAVRSKLTGTQIINGKLLESPDVMNYGKKAFNLIEQKCQKISSEKQKYINLTKDPLFQKEALEILKNITNCDPSAGGEILSDDPKCNETALKDLEHN